MGGLSVLESDDITSLKELIKSDFEMSANDKDFKLSFEQLVKACKIMLYKINISSQKTTMKYEQSK